MGRKSSIERKPPPVRARIEQFLRENRLTIEEMRAAITAEFGPEAAPSSSAMYRYKIPFDEMVGRMREIETAANVVVGELGEGVGEKAGALLAQSITTLATNAALRAHGEEEISYKDIATLARAARNAIDARRMSLQERQTIEAAARDRMLREQKAKLATLEKKGGFDAETLRRIRQEVYGIHE